jgi:hypothetical protein
MSGYMYYRFRQNQQEEENKPPTSKNVAKRLLKGSYKNQARKENKFKKHVRNTMAQTSKLGKKHSNKLSPHNSPQSKSKSKKSTSKPSSLRKSISAKNLSRLRAIQYRRPKHAKYSRYFSSSRKSRSPPQSGALVI